MFAHALTAPKAKTDSHATPARASEALLTKKPQDLAGNTRADPHAVPGSAGQPLASEVQSYFSAGFGHDFSRVRIHADASAAATARALGANAYTVGAHIAFAPGLYQPTNPAGMRLLAHELAHVVQQRGGGESPGAVQEQDADAAARAVVAGEEPKVRAPSQVGIAAQSEPSAVAKVKSTPFEQVMWFYHFYIDRLGYEYKDTGGNKVRLINPKGGHFVDLTLDFQSPGMVSVVVAGKSFEASEYNFASERFETRARHIEMVEYERERSIPERIGTGITVTAKVVGGAGLCVWGTAETVGAGAVAACGYGADLAASALGDLRGEDSRTLSNRTVTAGLSEIVGDETAQQLTDNAEAAINIMLGAYGASKPTKGPGAAAGPRPSVPEVVAPKGSIGAKPPLGGATAFQAGAVADEFVVAAQAVANPGQKMLLAAMRLSGMGGYSAAQKVEIILAFFKRISFSISKQGVTETAEYFLMHSEDSGYAFRILKATGEIVYGKFDRAKLDYVWTVLN